MRFFCCLLFVLLGFGQVRSQQESERKDRTEPENSIGVRGYAGFLALHRRSLEILVDEHVVGFDVFYERAFSGEKPWHRSYAYPSWGLNLQALDLGSEILGRSIRLVPYLNFPLLEHGTFSANLRFGWGIGYVEHSFHRTDNYKAVAIGTKLNSAVQLAVELNKRFGNTTVGLGISVDHLSNGSYSKPNLGLNIPAANVAVRQHFGTPRTKERIKLDTTVERTPSWYLRAGVGVHEAEPAEGPKHVAYNLSALWVVPFTFKMEVSLGIDLFSKTTLPYIDPELVGKGREEMIQLGMHAGAAMNFGDIALLFEPGFYLITPTRLEGSLYHRVGVRKYFGERWFASVLIKTHFAVADYYEWGGGIRL